ncbi:MAG: HlyD family efflux transporter periplasmic adaptor subunit [Novosphingobium sp.]
MSQEMADSAAAPAQRADEASLWGALATAGDAGAFCRAWLALQCERTPGARSGLVLLETADNQFAPAAIWPPAIADATPLRGAAEKALTEAQAVIEPMAGHPDVTVIAYPVSGGDRVHGAVVLSVAGTHPQLRQTLLRELHWGVGWLVSMAWQHQAGAHGRSAAAATVALDAIAAMHEEESLEGAAVALCNSLALDLVAERASLGLTEKGAIKLAAMSHGAWSYKRSDLAEHIEAVMDEAQDQAASLTWPIPDGDTGIHLQQQRLAAVTGHAAIAAIPVTDRGLPVGVIVLERGVDGPAFSDDELLMAEAVAGLAGPALARMKREERLVSGRIRAKTVTAGQALLGPRRPLAKTLVIGALILLVLLLLPIARFRVSADAVLEGRVQRAAAVPFSGFIARSYTRAGDMVKEGQLLATLDDRDLRIDQARSQSSVDQLDRHYREALAKHARADMSLYGAQLNQASADLRLAEYKLSRTRITAPISGVLVSGDVSQLVGTPVQEGQVLFEVAPAEDFRVVLQADEGDIPFLKPGQKGRFAPTGLGGDTVPFTVTKLTSVTAAQDGRNTFRVEAELAGDASAALRPGMEGVAKVDVGHHGLLWIWTRSLRNWMRLFFWKWLP